MGKIKKTVFVEDRERDIQISVDVMVDVNAEGYFTTTLCQSDAEMIESYGIDLAENRVHKRGFFKDQTLAGLLFQIRKVLETEHRRCFITDMMKVKVLRTSISLQPLHNLQVRVERAR